MSEPIPASRVRRAVAFSVALLVAMAALFGGAAYVWATRPIASEAQIADAAARVQQARRAPVEACPRPVLRGVALPGDGAEGVRELAGMQSPFFPCLLLIGGNLMTAREVFLVTQSSRRLASPLPLSIETRVAAECAGLDTAVQALLQRESGCTAHRLFLAERDVPDMRTLEWALFVLARARIHAGQLQEGMELLLDVIRLGQDLSRGTAGLVPARVGIEIQSWAAQQVEALLASDLAWTTPMLEELARQARVLAASTTDPLVWFRHHEVWLAEHALEALHGPAEVELSEQALVDIATADFAASRLPDCVGVTLDVCIARHRDARMENAVAIAAQRRYAWIPGFEQGARIRLEYDNRLFERDSALSGAAHNEALLRALPVLFLHRRMSLLGTCPTAEALQAEALANGLEGVEVQPSTEPLQPLHLRTTAAPEAHLRAYCPALHEHDTASGGLP